MKTIVYKKILNQYRITEIRETSGNEICIKFEEPIEAKLLVGKLAFEVSYGIAKIPQGKLSDGEIRPNLYTGCRKEEIEGFFMLAGVPLCKSQDDEYLMRLGEAYEKLLTRLDEYGEELLKIKERLDGKLKF